MNNVIIDVNNNNPDQQPSYGQPQSYAQPPSYPPPPSYAQPPTYPPPPSYAQPPPYLSVEPFWRLKISGLITEIWWNPLFDFFFHFWVVISFSKRTGPATKNRGPRTGPERTNKILRSADRTGRGPGKIFDQRTGRGPRIFVRSADRTGRGPTKKNYAGPTRTARSADLTVRGSLIPLRTTRWKIR